MTRWGRILGTLADVVFPRGCPLCDRTLPQPDDIWCPACTEALLSATGSDYCRRCGLSVGAYLVNPDGCPACRKNRNLLDGIARVGPYGSLVGEMVRRYKYGRRQQLDRPLGSLLAAGIQGQSWLGEIDALVPVPTSWMSRLQYRFRPVDLLAKQVGRELSLPVLPLLYVRGKKRKQVDLSSSERARNVRGVFRVRRRARVEDATLCVIDDVCTSGSTLREVARVLKRAGAGRVYGAALAKTDPAAAKVLGA